MICSVISCVLGAATLWIALANFLIPRHCLPLLFPLPSTALPVAFHRLSPPSVPPPRRCGEMPVAEQQLGRRSYMANVAFIDEWVGKIMVRRQRSSNECKQQRAANNVPPTIGCQQKCKQKRAANSGLPTVPTKVPPTTKCHLATEVQQKCHATNVLPTQCAAE